MTLSPAERIAELEETLRQRDETLAAILSRRYPTLGLTPGETHIVNVLLASAGSVLPESLISSREKWSDAGVKTIHVAIHRLRKKLTPSGIVIDGQWGFGYYLATPSKAILRGLLG